MNRWLIPLAGGPNAQEAIRLLPALVTLSQQPEIHLCQVFGRQNGHSELDRGILDKSAMFLRQRLNIPIWETPLCSDSVVEAVLDCVKQEHSDVIMLGASRAGLLQQMVSGNIPAAIASRSQQTVILVRGTGQQDLWQGENGFSAPVTDLRTEVVEDSQS
jgi:CIC family chloride channel protein